MCGLCAAGLSTRSQNRHSHSRTKRSPSTPHRSRNCERQSEPRVLAPILCDLVADSSHHACAQKAGCRGALRVGIPRDSDSDCGSNNGCRRKHSRMPVVLWPRRVCVVLPQPVEIDTQHPVAVEAITHAGRIRRRIAEQISVSQSCKKTVHWNFVNVANHNRRADGEVLQAIPCLIRRHRRRIRQRLWPKRNGQQGNCDEQVDNLFHVHRC